LEIAAAAGLELDGVERYARPRTSPRIRNAEPERSHPHPSHPQVSPIVARDRFGLRGEEILPAIENHSLGRPGMSLIGCIVFVADSIKPGRENTLELEELRLGEPGKSCSSCSAFVAIIY
jgi:HD superfamily phosphohydrolase YqeK